MMWMSTSSTASRRDSRPSRSTAGCRRFARSIIFSPASTKCPCHARSSRDGTFFASRSCFRAMPARKKFGFSFRKFTTCAIKPCSPSCSNVGCASVKSTIFHWRMCFPRVRPASTFTAKATSTASPISRRQRGRRSKIGSPAARSFWIGRFSFPSAANVYPSRASNSS